VRGNGLSAAAYVAVADLDPRSADALLDALRDRGVAAYAAASPDPVDGPEQDVDRLYVDVAAVEQARALLRMLADSAGPDAGFGDDASSDPLDRLDIDAEFAAIVAEFHTSPPGRHAIPDAPDTADDKREADERPAAGQPSYTGWDDLLRPVPPPESVPEPDAEDRYVPPPPPPLPKADLRTRAAWAAVLGGPLVLFAAVLVGWQLEDWVMLLAAVSFLVGFVALVARLGDRPDDEDDDGAVV
jgi:hypothetical protein